jgi:hypothetical protein
MTAPTLAQLLDHAILLGDGPQQPTAMISAPDFLSIRDLQTLQTKCTDAAAALARIRTGTIETRQQRRHRERLARKGRTP